MKKHFKQILALCLVSMMVLSSCNGNNVEPETTEATTTIQTEAESTSATTEKETVADTEADSTTAVEVTTAPDSTETTAVETTTAEETSIEETTAPETSAEVTTAPETTAEETSAPETTVEETSAPETTTAEETSAPETTAPETSVEETSVEETSIEETSVEETSVEETTVEETSVEETSVEETTVEETSIEETSAPETTVEETTVEETTVEETSAEETSVEETSEDTSEEITEAPTEETSEEESETETEAPTTEAPTTSSNPLDKYKLGFGSDMDMSEFDPVEEHATVVAPQDDPEVFYWFDHITEKVDRYTINQNGRQNYTIQMAKNEVEGCQFFLYAPTQRKINVKISDFANSYGETLKTELGVEFYMEDGYVDMHFYGNPVYPDAVVPYESYISKTEGGYYEEGAWVSIGPYSPKTWDLANYPYKDTSRGFVVQATTTSETRTGEYMATIEIYDAETGDCIKMMNLYTYVYNVTLSEETALDTSFQIWPGDLLEQYAYLGSDASHADILKAVAEFLLEYRITPSGTADYGTEWLSNPRVTTIRVTTKEQFDALKNDPILAEKLFFYGQDEPGTPRPNAGDPTGKNSIAKLKEEAEMLLSWGWDDYRMVSPFELNITYKVDGSKDQIDYMSRYVTIWCPKFLSFTPRALSFMAGSMYTHSVAQDRNFGEFAERMAKYVAEGDELWAYVSCVPAYTAPYQNILIFNDGADARTMFWTCYNEDITGFLYWHVSNYVTNGGTPGANNFTMRCPFPKEGPGDGILIYPGATYGQLDPIPSIRLINMREGIEDYQLLTMLEEAMGEAYTDELVHHIATSTITFTQDDDVIYNVHSYLLRALEAAANN